MVGHHINIGHKLMQHVKATGLLQFTLSFKNRLDQTESLVFSRFNDFLHCHEIRIEIEITKQSVGQASGTMTALAYKLSFVAWYLMLVFGKAYRGSNCGFL